ncbi:type II toxin-antitoxin system VapC family toxin [Variovorax sp. RT4R15]|uniref:type II toxin-antitoxin system VapC family toxin n=1 Tax=Variovorax sp. RT4R15 TaxID=3443737 RepID=UPI003F46BAAE
MYLIDTNVISELRRPEKASPAVVAWAGSIAQDETFLSAITVYELEVGVQQKERADAAQGAILRAWLTGQVLAEFAERIIELDGSAAAMAARLTVVHQISAADAFIASCAITRQLTIVTRNVKHFAPSNVPIINPWDYKPV